MITALPDVVNANPALVRRGRWTDADMLFESGDDAWVVAIRAGRIEAVTPVDLQVTSYDFAIRGTAEAWEKFWSSPPPPMHHDLHALIRAGKVRLEGDLDMLQGNLLYLKLVLESLRGRV
ncbi:MAG: hypothetical protein AAF439_02085 [Pseudomonadota bacterium]